MLIKRVYNNNVVLVTRDDGNEAVLLGRSLGFNQKIGDRVDERLIEQVFLPSSSDASLAMASLLSETPLDWVRAANQIVEFAVHRLGLRNTQVLLLGIVDHLSFALQRAKQGIEMDFPLKWEVANLYPAELEAG